jgi:hypothetical protein
MNKIHDAIKCVNCREVLDSAVLLPCGCSICLKHTQTDLNETTRTILCCNCEIDHSLSFTHGPFRSNTALTQIISAEIANIEELFSQDLKNAKHSCSRLEQYLAEIDHVLTDPFNFTYEAIEHLKSVAQLRVEEKQMSIDEEAFVKLDEFKASCKSYFKSSEYSAKSRGFERKIEAARQGIKNSMFTLNELKRNELEWMRIKRESEEVIERFKIELKTFKRDSLLQKRFATYRFEIEKILGKIEIEPRFGL